ncbi:MAG: FlgD immunoglobulin-like domain containing protein [Candidatus Krumholzibacteriota bacterium]
MNMIHRTGFFAFLFLLAFSAVAGIAGAVPFVQQRTWSGEVVGDQFGYAVSPAGDINGDGMEDLLVGANVNDLFIQSGGRVYVFLGGQIYPDLPSFGFSGSVERGYVGGALAGGADLNADGYDDWAAGAPGPGPDDIHPGRVYVFFGGADPDSVPDLILDGGVPGGQFGAALCLVPDLDGDGYGDLVVGSPRAGDGLVSIFRGGPGGPAAVPSVDLHPRPGDRRFGKSLAFVPDRDGDQRDELLVGAPRSSQAATWAGAVLLFEGTANLDTVPDLVLLGENAGDEFGFSLGAGSDTDGDGFTDILVGAPFSNQGLMIDVGRVYLFGNAAAADTVADLVLNGDQPEERFGTAVALGFDWNGDGWHDLAVGAPDRATPDTLSGAVEVYFGGGALDTIPDELIDGGSTQLHLGTSLAPGGDLQGSLGSTLCVGGYNAINAGQVLLFGRDEDRVTDVPSPSPARGFTLNPPWPNPSNPLTFISLEIAVPGEYRITIHDLRGGLVSTLHAGPLSTGTVVWQWAGLDRRGRTAPSGVYLVRAVSGPRQQTSRLTLVR